MAKAASARAEAKAKTKASAAAKIMASSVTVGAAATATYNNNPTKDKSVSNTTSSTPKSEACRTSLSMALTGKHSEGLERYLNNLEKQYGTSYVAQNVFKEASAKYDVSERDMQLWVSPQSQFTIMDKEALTNMGINLNDIKTSPNSTVKEAGLYSAQSYIVVHNNSPLSGTDGYITEYEYNHLVATVAGEAGGVSISNSYGVVSTSLNAIEEQRNGDIMSFLEKNCWPYGENYKWYVDADGNKIISGNGTEKDYNNAKIAVDIALSGTRAFPKEVQFGVGNWQYLYENDLLDQHDPFNKFSTTSGETSKYIE